jgi:RNA polymerase sigma-70 factor (ECF subfamily)
MDEASDRQLVVRTRGGEADAFGELVRRYQTSVYNVCYRLLADSAEAEDQAQEAFLRAYRHLGTYDDQRRSARGSGGWRKSLPERAGGQRCLW